MNFQTLDLEGKDKVPHKTWCIKVALYSLFSLSFMFKSRHASASAVGPIVIKIGVMIPYSWPAGGIICGTWLKFAELCTEQPESWIQICTKNTIKSHLKVGDSKCFTSNLEI